MMKVKLVTMPKMAEVVVAVVGRQMQDQGELEEVLYMLAVEVGVVRHRQTQRGLVVLGVHIPLVLVVPLELVMALELMAQVVISV
jgi:Na+-transporting NADH:ubiquinone oxidoreductase subunit NqrB